MKINPIFAHFDQKLSVFGTIKTNLTEHSDNFTILTKTFRKLTFEEKKKSRPKQNKKKTKKTKNYKKLQKNTREKKHMNTAGKYTVLNQ